MGGRYLSVFGMALVLAIVLAACGSTEDDEPEPTVTRIPDAANAPVLSPAGDASPVAGVGEASTPGASGSPDAAESPEPVGSPAGSALEIASFDIHFEPDTLTVPADTTSVVSLPNEGAGPHNFAIDALEISVDLAPGEVKEVEINAPAGEYEFYCNVPGHREAGMVGTLTVE